MQKRRTQSAAPTHPFVEARYIVPSSPRPAPAFVVAQHAARFPHHARVRAHYDRAVARHDVVGAQHAAPQLARTPKIEAPSRFCFPSYEPSYETRNLFSSTANNPSATNASNAAGIAPARITASLTMATPRKINVPNPPAPIAAAIVATPMVITVAVRTPARITESASGRRTRHITCHGVIPIAVAASSTAASIPVNPTYVFRRIGNNAYTTSATTAVRFPIPPMKGMGIRKPNSAKLGIVWNTLATPSAKLRNAGRSTIKIPSGI